MWRLNSLASAVLFAVVIQAGPLGAAAAVQTGTFYGVFDSSMAHGVINGIDPNTLNGDAVTGSFSYDPATYTFSNTGLNYNFFYGGPINFTVAVGGYVISYTGSYGDRILTGTMSEVYSVASYDDADHVGSILVGPGSLYKNPLDLNSISFVKQPGIVQITGDRVNPDYPNYWNIDVLATFPSTIPEPSTWGLMLLGFFGVASACRRRGKVARLIAEPLAKVRV